MLAFYAQAKSKHQNEPSNSLAVQTILSEDQVLIKTNGNTPTISDRPESAITSDNDVSGVPEVLAYSQEEVIQLIRHWSEYFSVPVEHPLRIAKCESNYRWNAKNKSSSASGVFQYLNGTWAKTFEGKAGVSVFDADANIRAAIRHMSVHGYDAWECK